MLQQNMRAACQQQQGQGDPGQHPPLKQAQHKDKDSNKPNIEIEINDKDTNNNKAKTADYNKIHEVRRGRTGGKREGRRREGEGGGEGGRGGAEEAEGGVGEDREEKPDTEARN